MMMTKQSIMSFVTLILSVVLIFVKIDSFSIRPTLFPSLKHSTLSSSSSLSLSGGSTGNNNGNCDDYKISVLCVGETLWDCLVDGNCYLGGAPTNVAVHLASLASLDSNSNSGGGDSTIAIASCIGKDDLGEETLRLLQSRKVVTDYIQQHETLSTGKVVATIDESTGDASYKFDTPSSWDNLQLTDDLRQIITTTSSPPIIIVMGTIAGRLAVGEASSASTLLEIRNKLAPKDSLVFDVNLRPPWYTPSNVLQLARGSNSSNNGESPALALIKVNEEELAIMEGWLLQQEGNDEETDNDDNNNNDNNNNNSLYGQKLKTRMKAFAKAMNANRVCVTRGQHGAALWCSTGNTVADDDDDDDGAIFAEHDGFPTRVLAKTKEDGKEQEESPPPDTIGAGDSFLAALIRSLLIEKESPHKALERGCALGGYVASCSGATPNHEDAPTDMRDVFAFLP